MARCHFIRSASTADQPFDSEVELAAHLVVLAEGRPLTIKRVTLSRAQLDKPIVSCPALVVRRQLGQLAEYVGFAIVGDPALEGDVQRAILRRAIEAARRTRVAA